MYEVKLSASGHRITDDAAMTIRVILFKAKQTRNSF
jgi:hypothetical protein